MDRDRFRFFNAEPTIVEEVYMQYLTKSLDEPIDRERIKQLVDYFVTKYNLEKADPPKASYAERMKKEFPWRSLKFGITESDEAFFDLFDEFACQFKFTDECFWEWTDRCSVISIRFLASD